MVIKCFICGTRTANNLHIWTKEKRFITFCNSCEHDVIINAIKKNYR